MRHRVIRYLDPISSQQTEKSERHLIPWWRKDKYKTRSRASRTNRMSGYSYRIYQERAGEIKAGIWSGRIGLHSLSFQEKCSFSIIFG
ncbi:hypothetical protein JTE90_013793 [Oedothorax gibbosus]|uniref:Uncharacterized protein n=1 Tax=Oedothorax gibbosus TaxID=931172 RepID=A0AAV6VKU5_9ARAC|nr:hypothetical protein JTE90_013793 [Oedothorax gibbosus]